MIEQESIKILMLQDAGFPATDLQKKYLKLVGFVKSTTERKSGKGWYSCTCNDELSYEAFELLKEIGESE